MKPDRTVALLVFSAVLLWQPLKAGDKDEHSGSILKQLPTSSERVVSTVPGNGDENPYGVAFVPDGFAEGDGPLEAGDILVSNFNNSVGDGNQQGTGTTIVRITRQGQQSVFFQGPPGLGLTTALGVLRRGFVLVGNLPTMDGSSSTIQPTSLLVIDRHGNLFTTLSDPALLNGPWDLTVVEEGSKAHVFVSNVLSGTVTRLDVSVHHGDKFTLNSKTEIAHGYMHRTDPAALVVGPTGLAYDRERDVLYVASTGDNAIFAIPHPLHTNQDIVMGTMVYQDSTHLHGPLALALAPNGNLITANGDAVNPPASGGQNLLIEFTRTGKFVAQYQVDSGAPGGAFGLAISGGEDGVRFAAVDDDQNTLDIWRVRTDD